MSSPDPASSDRPQPPVGIDLGTTLSVVAYVDPTGRPTTVPNGAGELLTPSAVAFEQGEVVVGREAIKGAVLAPDAFADCFKRDMGRATYHRSIAGRDVPPEVLNAFLLRRLKEDAERRLGPIRRVVITVPAFFDEGRRKVTQDAGGLAGLDVLDIINEPTAAAVTFGYYRAMQGEAGGNGGRTVERLLVYDLGGGTFDVTILEVDGTTFRTVATDGDVQLGGHDFDERLVADVSEKFLAAHGLDPRSDPSDAVQLWRDVQEVKHALSERRKTAIVCHHHGIRMRQEITREQFETLTQDLLGRTEATTSLVLRQAGLQWDQIDRVLPVGGSSRMPMVTDMLRRLTGKEPDRSLSPDEAVAHGAALYAAMLMAEPSSPHPKMDLINVNSHSLGVVGVHAQTGERRNVTLIPKNTPLPARIVRQFQTARANQPNVNVPVVEGESPRPEHCIALGQCIIRDLPSDLPKGTPIEVTYEYAANGRLSVTARIPTVRQSAHVDIERKQTDTLHDLDAWNQQLGGGDTAQEPPPTSVALPPDAIPENADRSTLLKRLDMLYIEIGTRAAMLSVPPKVRRSYESARVAADELHHCEQGLQQVNATLESNSDEREARYLAGEVARARLSLQNAKAKSRFAYLTLGRDCMDAGFNPPDLAQHTAEIRLIRTRLRDH